MKTRLEEASSRWCQIQRRRARATSARCCSAARRLFFKADAVALEKAPQSAAAARYPSLAQSRGQFIQRPIRLFSDQRANLLRTLVQRRAAPAPRLRRTAALIAPRPQPLDRRAGTDRKPLRGFAPRRSLFNRYNHARPQIRRAGPRHRTLRLDPGQDSPVSQSRGIPRFYSAGNRSSVRCNRQIILTHSSRESQPTRIPCPICTNPDAVWMPPLGDRDDVDCPSCGPISITGSARTLLQARKESSEGLNSKVLSETLRAQPRLPESPRLLVNSQLITAQCP